MLLCSTSLTHIYIHTCRSHILIVQSFCSFPKKQHCNPLQLWAKSITHRFCCNWSCWGWIVSFCINVGKLYNEGVGKCSYFSHRWHVNIWLTNEYFEQSQALNPLKVTSEQIQTVKSWGEKIALEINNCFACQTNMTSRVLSILLLQASISGWWRLRWDCGILKRLQDILTFWDCSFSKGSKAAWGRRALQSVITL